jgi:hypothetical protein
MDPVTLLVSTLALGATAALKETAGNAVRDAYKGLKDLIVHKFGSQPAVDALERTPASKNKRESAAEDLAAAAKDEEVLRAADELAKIVQRDDPKVGEVIGVSIDTVVAKFLEIDTVRSSGSAVSVKDSEFVEGVTIKNVVAGAEDSSHP